MTVSIYSRQAIENLIASGSFPENTAVISFYDPPSVAAEEYHPIDYSRVTKDVFYVELPDMDWYAYAPAARLRGGMLPDAEGLAAFIRGAVMAHKDIICQCEYGRSRSAACAAAILAYYDHAGKPIFADARYCPNHLVYDEVMCALKKWGGDVT